MGITLGLYEVLTRHPSSSLDIVHTFKWRVSRFGAGLYYLLACARFFGKGPVFHCL